MTNPTLTTLLREAVEEERMYKICLVEDIIKAKRCLWAFGEKQHNEFLQEATSVKLWDELYDLDVLGLIVINNNYGHQITELMRVRLEVLK